MTVSNDRLPDHFDAPGKYLNHIETKVDGSYTAHSIDPDKKGKIEGFNTADGSYVAKMTDKDGNVSQASPGGTKTFSDSDTNTTTGHRDVSAGGGEANRNAQGSHNERGQDSTTAVEGSQQSASSSSAKTYTSGDGHHHMAGDQAFSVEEGGIHYNVANGYTVTAKGSMQFDTTLEMSQKVGGNWGVTALKGKATVYTGDDITIESATSIVLKVGGSTITIKPSGITIVGTRVDLNP